MRKSLGSKRNFIPDTDIEKITKLFDSFKKAKNAKVFRTTEFGYRRISIERPLRLSVQFTDEKLETLRFPPKYKEISEWLYEKFGNKVTADPKSLKEKLEVHLKMEEISYKEKDLKEMLDSKAWEAQKELLDKSKILQKVFGNTQYDDYNIFLEKLENTLIDKKIKLDPKEKKQLLDAVTWKNPDAQKVISKIVSKDSSQKEIYGYFQQGDETIIYMTDSDLRDNENVPLTDNIEAYFLKEVKPHVPDAWIDATKTDAKDGKVGIIGYEIPFNRHFYEYKPPRDLEEIDKDLEAVTKEILTLLK